MDDLKHLREYTRELKKRLPREYFKPLPSRLLWLIPYVGLAVMGIFILNREGVPVFAKFGLAGVLGMVYSSAGFLGHEVLHGCVVRRPFIRDLVGALCFSPFLLGPKLWRKWHNVEHHGHTQGEDDPDAMGTLEDLRERPSLQTIYKLAPWLRSFVTFASFTLWFSVHSFLMLLRFFGDFARKDRYAVMAQFVLPVLGWTALMVWLGPGNFLFAYVLPVLVANFVVMSYIATNHLLNPLTSVNDPLVNSLTVDKPRWVDVMHLNFSHHTEHHIFPTMNPKFAPKVRALAKELWPDRYNEMPHWQALLTLWRTPRLYRTESELADPVRHLAYPTLGRGLDPDDVHASSFAPFEGDSQDAVETKGFVKPKATPYIKTEPSAE